jgi:putative transposase
MHNRKVLRSPSIDYSAPAIYFGTICLQDRTPLFGRVNDQGNLSLSSIGQMLVDVWRASPEQFPDVELDSFVTMPDHVHVLFATGCDPEATTVSTYGDILRWYKSVTTSRYSAGVHELGWPRYKDRLWQRGSYDHVIRNQADLEEKRAYIQANPWAFVAKRVSI